MTPLSDKVHVRDVRPGDVILYRGEYRTVGPKDIRTCEFMGRTVFGDCFMLGTVPVQRATFSPRNVI